MSGAFRSLTGIPDNLLDPGNEFNGLTSLELMEGVDMHTGVTPIKYMHGDSGSGELGDITYLTDKTECDFDKYQVT